MRLRHHAPGRGLGLYLAPTLKARLAFNVAAGAQADTRRSSQACAALSRSDLRLLVCWSCQIPLCGRLWTRLARRLAVPTTDWMRCTRRCELLDGTFVSTQRRRCPLVLPRSQIGPPQSRASSTFGAGNSNRPPASSIYPRPRQPSLTYLESGIIENRTATLANHVPRSRLEIRPCIRPSCASFLGIHSCRAPSPTTEPLNRNAILSLLLRPFPRAGWR
jgi:hypothetical protein